MDPSPRVMGISRRDFLKVASSLPAAAFVGRLLGSAPPVRNADIPNLILLVFDAWSADHLPMFGYARDTMPNLQQFAEQAVVFHRHYSAGTFTVPGTASLLTGLEPWSHRALALGGEISPKHRDHHMFSVLSGAANTLAYAQNEFADILLSRMARYLDVYVPTDNFSLRHNLTYTRPLFKNDPVGAYAAFETDIFQRGVQPDASFFLGLLHRVIGWRSTRVLDAEYRMRYPRGLPTTMDPFLLEDVVDGAIGLLDRRSGPSLAYLHFYPPHGYYRPKGKFNHSFETGWEATPKPVHPLVSEDPGTDAEASQRLLYDQYLASWDSEIGRLLEHLRTSGLLDNSYVVITSDHGEMFERGVIGHNTPLIYEPLVHVPLIISRPGLTQRIDVQTPTSSVDVLPTLAALAGVPAPGWAEGRLLPQFGGTPDPDRSIYVMDAKTNSAFRQLTNVSLSLNKQNHRLTYYQYPSMNYARFELYDLLEDPQELNNIYSEGWPLADGLKAELLQKLDEVNASYKH